MFTWPASGKKNPDALPQYAIMTRMPFFLLCLLFFPGTVFTQNLLMNEGFEEENICSEYDKNCAPEAWISTSLMADYYFDDTANAFSGRHFVGLHYAEKGLKDTRAAKIIRSRLLCALRKGKTYQLSFYIRSRHAQMDSIGILFTGDDILLHRSANLKELPDLWVKEGLEGGKQGSWQKVVLQYRANGNEQFINIGDFKKNGYSFSSRPDLGSGYYFFLDEIRLLADDPSERLCHESEMIREEAYDFNPRHQVFDRWRYSYRKDPPILLPLTLTVIRRIDTLIIPDVLFAVNSYELNPAAYRLLDSFGKQLNHRRIDSLVVEGHTDSTGSIQLNQVLSVNRALAVGRFLQPFTSSAIRARGWASVRPVADNRSSAGRQKNRRVEIYLYFTE